MKNLLNFIIFIFMMTQAFAQEYHQLFNTHIPKDALTNPVGRMDPDKELLVVIQVPVRNKAERDQLLQNIYDPKSPQYHHYLTPQEFSDRFGPTLADYDALVSFFKNHGFIILDSKNRSLLGVRASVRVIESTFHTTLKKYKHPAENRIFYAPDPDPTLDLNMPIAGISGLDDYSRIYPIWGKHPAIKKWQDVPIRPSV